MNNMAEMRRLKTEVRRRSMIFNCDGKERTAKFYGLPLDTFYDLPFAQWIDVDRHYHAAISSEVK